MNYDSNTKSTSQLLSMSTDK